MDLPRTGRSVGQSGHSRLRDAGCPTLPTIQSFLKATSLSGAAPSAPVVVYETCYGPGPRRVLSEQNWDAASLGRPDAIRSLKVSQTGRRRRDWSRTMLFARWRQPVPATFGRGKTQCQLVAMRAALQAGTAAQRWSPGTCQSCRGLVASFVPLTSGSGVWVHCRALWTSRDNAHRPGGAQQPAPTCRAVLLRWPHRAAQSLLYGGVCQDW